MEKVDLYDCSSVRHMLMMEERYSCNRDVEKFFKLCRNSRNFIRSQTTYDGHRKKVKGDSYRLLKTVSEISSETCFVSISPKMKALIEVNKVHRINMFYHFNLNHEFDGEKVFRRINLYLNACANIFASDVYKRMDSNRRLNESRRAARIKNVVNSCLGRKGRVLLVRVDLFYSRGTDDLGSSSRDISKDINRLRRNFNRNSKLSKGFLSGVVKIEYGFLKGPHAHLLLMYDGGVRFKDASIGEVVGRYWQDVIAEGKGAYFNSNRTKSKKRIAEAANVSLASIALGRIRSCDIDKLMNLDVLVRYLSKGEQEMCYASGRKFRSLRFFRGSERC